MTPPGWPSPMALNSSVQRMECAGGEAGIFNLYFRTNNMAYRSGETPQIGDRVLCEIQDLKAAIKEDIDSRKGKQK